MMGFPCPSSELSILDLTRARILKLGSGDLGVTTGIWNTLAVAAIPALKEKCIL